METFSLIIQGAAAAWTLIMAIMTQTKNPLSTVIFKGIPFLFGVGLLISALYHSGYLISIE